MTQIPSRMRVVVTTGHGGLDKLVYRETVPVPAPGPGQVLIEIGAVKPLLERGYPLAKLPEAPADFMKKAHMGNLVITVKAG